MIHLQQSFNTILLLCINTEDHSYSTHQRLICLFFARRSFHLALLNISKSSWWGIQFSLFGCSRCKEERQRGKKVYLRRQSVSVVDPDRWLSPLTVLPSPPGLRGQKGVDEPGRSRLMSQNGSIVVETPLEEREGSPIIAVE